MSPPLSCFITPGLTILAWSVASDPRNGANGVLRVKRIVVGFTTVMPLASRIPSHRPAAPLPIFSRRVKLNCTALASRGVPSVNFTPRRRRKVKVFPSGETVHDSASWGSTSVVPPLSWTSRS